MVSRIVPFLLLGLVNIGVSLTVANLATWLAVAASVSGLRGLPWSMNSSTPSSCRLLVTWLSALLDLLRSLTQPSARNDSQHKKRKGEHITNAEVVATLHKEGNRQ